MQTIFTFHNSKWFYSIWALLFALCLVLLWWRRKTWVKGYSSFFWFIIIAVMVVYCPLLSLILVPRFLPSWGEYERLAWLFFEIPLVSYVLIMLSTEISHKKKRWLFAVLSFAFLFFIGSPDNREYFKKPHNIYNITPEAVSVCDKINTLSPDGQITLCILLDPNSSYINGTGLDGTLLYGIRTYESRFQLLIQSITPKRSSNDSFELSIEKPIDIDYFICPRTNVVCHDLEQQGYVNIDTSEHYAIFYNPKKDIGGNGL